MSAPNPSPGTVRFYHGGVIGGAGGGSRWVTPDLAYAEGYARKSGGQVYYVDVPENHPDLRKAFDDTGTNTPAPYIAFEAPAALAGQLKPLQGGAKPQTRLSRTPPPPPPGNPPAPPPPGGNTGGGSPPVPPPNNPAPPPGGGSGNTPPGGGGNQVNTPPPGQKQPPNGNNGSPPSPPSPPPQQGTGAVGELTRRLENLRDFYEQNPTLGPDSLAARGLKGRINRLSSSVSSAFGQLTPDEQKQAMANPAMQALEQQRREVQEDELNRRKELNEQLKTGSGYLAEFMRGLTGSGGQGVAGGVGGVTGGVVAALAGVALSFREFGMRGLAVGDPSTHSTMHTSERLLQGQLGQDFSQAAREKAHNDQLLALIGREQRRRGIADPLADAEANARRLLRENLIQTLADRYGVRIGANPRAEQLQRRYGENMDSQEQARRNTPVAPDRRAALNESQRATRERLRIDEQEFRRRFAANDAELNRVLGEEYDRRLNAAPQRNNRPLDMDRPGDRERFRAMQRESIERVAREFNVHPDTVRQGRRIAASAPRQGRGPLENVETPTEGGYTTALGLSEELQVQSLQKRDVDNEILRMQLETLRGMRMALDRITGNTNEFANFHPAFE